MSTWLMVLLGLAYPLLGYFFGSMAQAMYDEARAPISTRFWILRQRIFAAAFVFWPLVFMVVLYYLVLIILFIPVRIVTRNYTFVSWGDCSRKGSTLQDVSSLHATVYRSPDGFSLGWSWYVDDREDKTRKGSGKAWPRWMAELRAERCITKEVANGGHGTARSGRSGAEEDTTASS